MQPLFADPVVKGARIGAFLSFQLDLVDQQIAAFDGNGKTVIDQPRTGSRRQIMIRCLFAYLMQLDLLPFVQHMPDRKRDQATGLIVDLRQRPAQIDPLFLRCDRIGKGRLAFVLFDKDSAAVKKGWQLFLEGPGRYLCFRPDAALSVENSEKYSCIFSFPNYRKSCIIRNIIITFKKM